MPESSATIFTYTRNPDTTIQPASPFKTALRKIIPLRASVFEKSKRDLDKELQSVKRQLNSLEEQNKDLADKLTVCLEELQKQNGAFRADGR